MERKIGEIFNIDNEWYQVVKSNGECCKGCAFHEKESKAKYADTGSCILREDRKQVIFKKLEKVGEPITICGKSYQRYKNFMLNSLTLCKYCIFYSNSGCTYKSAAVKCNNHDFYVEIKQIKEDMKQEIEYFEDENTKHSNSEKIGKSLKEFDLEAAKAGKPVCTNDNPVKLEEKINTITISLEEYNKLIKYANYINNWCGEIYECPKCGCLNPKGNICINCAK